MYRIGYVSGMFDILHVGHINLLKYAKEMCEYLIVAVGTDDFIRDRKKHEPIMTFEERSAIIGALRYVDEVVPANNLDKVTAYHKYKFDVMIAGSDHAEEQIYVDSEKNLKELGVTVLYYPRISDVSSTKMRNKIKNL